MAKEIYKNKQEKELIEILKDKRNSLRDFRFKISKGKVKNVKEGRNLKRDIAKILTALKAENNK